MLCAALRTKKIKFKTQHKINGHKVDIFIKPNICIEVDGKIFHNYPMGTEKDHRESQWLSANGYIVLRFWDSEVIDNMAGVVMKIRSYLHQPMRIGYHFPKFKYF